MHVGPDQRTLRISTRNKKLLKGLELGANVEVRAKGKLTSISLPEEFEDPDGEMGEFPGHIEVELSSAPEVSEKSDVREMAEGLDSEED